MARSFLTAINLNKNELQNAAVQNLGTAPAAPVKGQLYFNSTDNILYWCQNPVGPVWVAAQDAGGSGFPGYAPGGATVAETTFGLAKADGVATTVARADHTHGSPLHDAAAHSTIPISALATATSPINMGGYPIYSVATPTSNGDAVNKGYVDNAIAGLSWKEAVRLASTANVNLSLGFQDGVVLDGVTLVAGDRILVKNQTTGAENGIYICTAAAPTRATDFNSAGEAEGAAVFVMEGTTNADTAWVLTNNAPITIGTTALTFAQFVGGGAVTAGAGMTQSGNVLNVVAGDTTLTVAADDVRVNTSVIATVASLATYTRKYTTLLTALTAQAATHNFNSQAVVAEVYRTATPWDTVECDIERTTVNTVTVRFAVAPAANEYTLVVIG